MGSSYCGKNCNDCLDKEDVGCPGCKNGPGKESGALCEIARCCSDRENGECVMCVSSASCELLAERECMVQKWNGNRGRETEEMSVSGDSAGTTGSLYGAQRSNKPRDRRDAPFIHKSLIAIFWLFFVPGIGTFLSNESVFGEIPLVTTLGSVITIGACIAQAILMIRLGREEDAYKVAGICTFVGTALAFVGGVIIGCSVSVKYSPFYAPSYEVNKTVLIVGVVVLFAAVILELVSAYQFIVANARVVERRDRELSDHWYLMARLFLVIVTGIVVVPVLIFLLKIVGIIVALLYALGVLVFGILEYVFLYQTAERFRE